MSQDGVQVWAPVLEERMVKFNPRIEDAKNLEALGITYNGDGTWTIPARRFTDGGLYQWSGTAGRGRRDEVARPELGKQHGQRGLGRQEQFARQRGRLYRTALPCRPSPWHPF